jgi:(p)ppGpp synthase/HD superfamily hydrolase
MATTKQGPDTMLDATKKALKLAAYAHDRQKRKFPRPGESELEPYINHPRRVAEAFTQLYDWRYVVVALLHDVVEDSDITLNQVHDFFGEDVTNAVDAISQREGELFSDYLDRICANDIARMVKIADIRDNLIGLPEGHSLNEKYAKALKKLSY